MVMDEGEWSSPEAAGATRAALDGCFKVAFCVFAAVVMLAFVVALLIEHL